MMRAVLLDLFCKAGGAARGYHDAGFDVVGVDIEPQKRYPYPFVLGDALEVLRVLIGGGYITDNAGRRWYLRDFAAIHSSPPCQAHTQLRHIHGREYPDLVAPTRELLSQTGKPWVIENVMGAPLVNPVMLCGTMFPSLRVYRHRLFETSFFLLVPSHIAHKDKTPRDGHCATSPKGFITVTGHIGMTDYARVAMGIDWMTGSELSQAIPPAYTEFIGTYLMREIAR